MPSSKTVLQIAGLYIEDDPSPKPPLITWIQSECREGRFRSPLQLIADSQPEMLRVDLSIVESAEPDKIMVRVPCCVCDHESNHPFPSEVLFKIDPVTLECARV